MLLQEIFDKYEVHNLKNPKDKDVKAVESVQHLANVIEKNCSTMLEAVRKAEQPILRGIKSNDTMIITGIRPDRRPVEMSSEIHEALHEFFVDQGFPVTRKNAIFTTPLASVAGTWGDCYAIFIKDGWTGLVFDGMKKDYSFYAMNSIGRNLLMAEDAKDDSKKKMFYSKAVKEFKDLRPRLIKTSAELVKVIEKEYQEILFTGDSFVGVDFSSDEYAELKKLLKF